MCGNLNPGAPIRRAIQCRRDGLNDVELDALADSYTRPRPDMAFSFDDLQDARSDEIRATLGSDAAKDWIEGLLLMIAGILGFLAGGLIVVMIAWAAQSAGLDARTIAPTAAEVLAPGFDLEAKVAEVQP